MSELASRRVGGSCSHQKDGPKPVSQRLSCLMKDGVGCHRYLMVTPIALIKSPSLNEIDMLMTAARTSDAIRPFSLDQISQTIALCAKSASKLSGRHNGMYV